MNLTKEQRKAIKWSLDSIERTIARTTKSMYQIRHAEGVYSGINNIAVENKQAIIDECGDALKGLEENRDALLTLLE